MNEFRLFDYLPILLMFFVALGFAVSQILLSSFMGQRKRTRTKLMPYECGKDPVGSARERFSVKFYLVAVDFILFDVEVIFLIPFAVAFATLAISGLGAVSYIAVMLFVALVVVGFAYTWLKGSFEWSERARVEAKAEARTLARAEKLKSRTEVLGEATARKTTAAGDLATATGD